MLKLSIQVLSLLRAYLQTRTTKHQADGLKRNQPYSIYRWGRAAGTRKTNYCTPSLPAPTWYLTPQLLPVPTWYPTPQLLPAPTHLVPHVPVALQRADLVGGRLQPHSGVV